MAESMLDRMAQEMRRMLTHTQARWVHRKLKGGLELVLQRTDDQWRLALARRETWPSDNEVLVCAKAFGVPAPEDVDPKPSRKARRVSRTTSEAWYVMEIFWREREAQSERA